MNMRKSVLIAAMILIATVGIIVGIYAMEDGTADSDGETTTMINASVTITFSNETTWTYDNLSISTSNATVYRLLFKAGEAGNFSISSTFYPQYDSNLITAINGVENGQDNKYWQYWINDSYATVGADKQSVHNHDVVAWKFTGYS